MAAPSEAIVDPLRDEDHGNPATDDCPPPTYMVWHLKARGNYKALMAKLGQSLYHDVQIMRFLSDHIPSDLVGHMQTDEGKKLLEQFVVSLEEFEGRLTPVQKRLRKVCEQMNFKDYTPTPSWANGAHIFVTALVANEIESAFKPGELGKEDLIVSPEILEDINLAMSKRDGLRSYIHEGSSAKRSLAPVSPIDSNLARSAMTTAEKLMDPISFELMKNEVIASAEGHYEVVELRHVKRNESVVTKLTHSTGSLPRDTVGKSWGSKAYKSFTLPQADISLRAGPLQSQDADPHDDVGSACENETQVSALTVESSSWDAEMTDTPSVLEFIQHKFGAHVRPSIKNATSYAQYVRDHMARLIPEVAEPVFEVLPLESSIAHAFNGNDESKKSTLKSACKLLTAKAVECYSKESLAAFLVASVAPTDSAAGLLIGFAETSDMLAVDLANAIQPLVKQTCLEQQRRLRKQLEKSKADDGSHAVAKLLRSSIAEAMIEASSKVSIGGLADKAWACQKKEQKQRQLEESAQMEAEMARRETELSKGKGKSQRPDSKKYKFTQSSNAGKSHDKKFTGVRYENFKFNMA